MAKHTRDTPSDCSTTSFDVELRAVVEALSGSGTLSEQSLPRIVNLIERFCGFGERAFGIASLEEVSTSQAAAFVQAPTAHGEPASATMHLRRSALRLLFRTARELGLAESDPTLDLVLSPRSSQTTRALTDDEVALCRAASPHTLTSTRLPAAWALAEASARSGELGHIKIADIDLGCRPRVWLHGSTRYEPRWAEVSEWGATQLIRRLRTIGEDPERPVVYNGERGSDYHRQVASCVAIGDTLRRAGLADEPDIGPMSVVGWAGRQVMAETGRIDEVAHRLGIRSLDRAATLIGWDWQTDLEDGA